MTDEAGADFAGLDRMEARKAVVEKLETWGCCSRSRTTSITSATASAATCPSSRI